MTLHVHHSNRTERLVEAMAEVFEREASGRPRPEHVVIDGKGMERWLSLQLARRDGIFANPRFVFPRRVVLQALEAVLGPEQQAGESLEPLSCYEPEVLLWAIAELLPGLLKKRAFAPVRGYLGDSEPGCRRYVALAERIARTFDDYAVYRQEMVLGWQTSRRADQELPEGQRWQPALWRALVEHLGDQHMATRAQRFLDALAQGATLDPSFPRRLSLFGLSTMAPLYLRMLLALRAQVELHLFVLEPTAHFWSDIVSEREAFYLARREGKPEEELHLDLGHPLLASLGKQGRDFRIVLDGVGEQHRVDVDHHDEGWGESMLGRLQADLFGLSTGAGPRPLDAEDHSVSVHACHSALREVEVLHDQLLCLFDADPSLLPGDVVVMAPRIEDYAPFVDAVFGSGHAATRIRYSLADRDVRPTHALADAFFKVLECLRGRLSAPEVVDLLGCEPVRARFDLDPDDLPQVERWIEQAGIRWAEDAAHRAEAGHPQTALNTWRFGLERLFLGLALPLEERGLFEGVLSVDEVEGSTTELLGKLGDLCQTLFDFRRRLQGTRPVAVWQELLGALTDAFLLAPEQDAHQQNMIHDAITRLGERASLAGMSIALDLDPVVAQLESMLQAGRSSRGFVSGGVCFCSTLPMRAIPFKVVCLMGMNDEDFPRRVQPPGFDLLGKRHRPGDRSVRDDDRYLFLEALLSARARLIITYQGQSIHDNSRKAPSVVVSELLDVLSESHSLPELSERLAPESVEMRRRVRAHLVVEHPLQGFSRRYFGADPDPRLFSYSSHGEQVARALGSERVDQPPFADCPVELDEAFRRTVALDDLVRYFKHPTRSFLRRNLGLYLEEAAGELDDVEPAELSGLDRWKIYDPVLAQLCSGGTPELARRTIEASGMLPHGVFGAVELEENLPVVSRLAGRAGALRSGEPLEDLDVAIELGETLVTGVLRQLWPAGRVSVQYSRSQGHHLLDVWVRHLALCCLAPEGYSLTSHLVARNSEGDEEVISFPAVDNAGEILSSLVEIYLLGHRVPLPLFKNATWSFAKAWWENAKKDHKAVQAANSSYWSNKYRPFPGDDADPDVQQVFAGLDPLAPNFCLVPLPGQDVPDFKQLAITIYQPLLDHQRRAGA